MKRTLIPLMVLAAMFCHSGSARAKEVARMITELRSNPSYKVRLTAVLGLAKHADPRVVKALTEALNKESEDTKVRAFSAMALGRLRAEDSVSSLKKAMNSKDPFLRARAKAAYEFMCPSSLAGKRIYINMDRFKAKGPSASLAKSSTMMLLAKVLGARSEVTLGWPNCKRPTARDLSAKRMKAFFLDTTVTVTSGGGDVTCRVSVLFTTYPGQSIQGNAGARASVPGAPGGEVLSNLLEALVGAIQGDIGRFLDSQ